MTLLQHHQPARVAALWGSLILALISRPAAALPVHWISSVDGNWTTAANWDSGFLPRPEDDVFIDAPGSYRVTLDTSVSVRSLVVAPVSGVPTLVIAATAPAGPSLMTLTVALGVENLGAIELIRLYPRAAALSATGGNIHNAVGATLTSQGDALVGQFNIIDGYLVNQGTLVVTQPLGFDGQGFLNDSGGAFTLSSRCSVSGGPGMQVINEGAIEIAAGGQFSLSGGRMTGAGALAGSGACLVQDATFDMTTWPTPASVTMNRITRSVPTLIPAGTLTTLNSGTITGACHVAGTLNPFNLTVYGDFEVSGTVNVNRVTVNGVVHVLPTGRLQKTNTSSLVARDGLVNEGRFTLAATNSPALLALDIPDGTLENQATGTVELVPGGTSVLSLRAGLRNAGTLTCRRATTWTIPAGGHSENTGSLALSGGPLTLLMPAGGILSNGGTLSLFNNLMIDGGGLTNDPTGVVTGVGAIVPGAPGCLNAGTIRPGVAPGTGRLTFYGATTCTPTSLLDLEIGGPAASQYDAIGFDQVTLDGQLNLTLINGYVPPAGTSFPLLDWVGHTGTFAQLTGLDPGNGIHFEPVPGYPAFGASGVAFQAVAGGASGVATEPPTSDPDGAPRFVGAWPNPARGAFAFGVSVPRAQEIGVVVYDVSGRPVRALRAGSAGPGEERVVWDGRDDAGRALAAGVYLVRLQAGAATRVRRVAWLP